MATDRTFKFMEQMHLQPGYKRTNSDWFCVTSLEVKGQISKYVVWRITNA